MEQFILGLWKNLVDGAGCDSHMQPALHVTHPLQLVECILWRQALSLSWKKEERADMLRGKRTRRESCGCEQRGDGECSKKQQQQQKKVVLSFLSMTEEYLCRQCQNEWMLCWRVCVRGRESEWKIGQDSQRQTKRERHKREWKNSYVGLSLNPNARAEQEDNKAVGVCEPVSFHGLAFQIDTHPVQCYLNSQCTGIQTNQVQTNYPVTVSSHE